MNTQDLLRVLRGHYIAESTTNARAGGVFAHEVAINGDWGGPGTSRVDALYAGFTSASGRILVGHEIKVSRADWRAELAKVGKADRWADACHAWYIVAPSTDVVPLDELPDGWGLMLPPRSGRARRMKVAVKAHVKQDHSPPWWAVRSLMARLDTLDVHQRSAEIKLAVEARSAEIEKAFEVRARAATIDPKDRNRLIALDALERDLGLSVRGWRSVLDEGTVSPRDVVRGIRIASLLAQDAQALSNLEYVVRQLDGAVAGLKSAVPQVQALASGEPVEAP